LQRSKSQTHPQQQRLLPHSSTSSNTRATSEAIPCLYAVNKGNSVENVWYVLYIHFKFLRNLKWIYKTYQYVLHRVLWRRSYLIITRSYTHPIRKA
jgi:hypothetical protein